MIRAIVFLLITSLASAQGPAAWRIGGESVVFRLVGENLVNASCKECEALKVAREYGSEPLQKEWLQGGKNPFSVRCTKVMKGTVLIGIDEEGNQSAFCFFKKDGSYLGQF